MVDNKIKLQRGADTITIEILEDGSIKMDTNKISMPNHMNADQFLLEMITLAGGESKRQRKAEAVMHQHNGEYHSH